MAVSQYQIHRMTKWSNTVVEEIAIKCHAKQPQSVSFSRPHSVWMCDTVRKGHQTETNSYKFDGICVLMNPFRFGAKVAFYR